MSEAGKATRLGLSRDLMAWRCAQDIPDGAYVNLGIGIPEKVAAHVPAGREVVYHSENGILGFGPPPNPEDLDLDLINAGKKPVTMLPGAAFFHHADSFTMIRGGHVDFTILGAMQIGANGDLANWSTGDADAIPAVGGAMDLVAGVPNVLAITEHTTRDAILSPINPYGFFKKVITKRGGLQEHREGQKWGGLVDEPARLD